jgi:carboxymethylenebutenolidase
MGKTIDLVADDGHTLNAYRADSEDEPLGGVAIIQEVFGVNAHIRSVCDAFARAGYVAVAPALFDRVERGVELAYDEAGLARGRELRTTLGWNAPLLDVNATIRELRGAGSVAVVGYCWGGSVAWLAATRLNISAAVGYYGGQIVSFKDEHPQCPVMLHFGERDPMIPADDVSQIRSTHPGVPIYLYAAGHGFNCDARVDYDQASADTAKQRTLEFLSKHLA